MFSEEKRTLEHPMVWNLLDVHLIDETALVEPLSDLKNCQWGSPVSYQKNIRLNEDVSQNLDASKLKSLKIKEFGTKMTVNYILNAQFVDGGRVFKEIRPNEYQLGLQMLDAYITFNEVLEKNEDRYYHENKTSIKKLAADIIQVGVYKSFLSEYESGLDAGNDYFWKGWNKQVAVTCATNFHEEGQIRESSEPSLKQKFEHFWDCVFDDPGDFIAYWLNRMFEWLGQILLVTILGSFGLYILFLLMGAYLNQTEMATNLGLLMMFALIVGFVLTIIMDICLPDSLKKEFFKNTTAASLWLTIWHREAGAWVAYDYRFSWDNNQLNKPLPDGLALLSGYSKTVLKLAYSKLDYVERLLILPDLEIHRYFLEPLSNKEKIAVEQTEKRAHVKQILYDKLMAQVSTFIEDNK